MGALAHPGLLLSIVLTLAVVCAGTALTTTLLQRAYLLDDLDAQVSSAAQVGLNSARSGPRRPGDLSFLTAAGHPTGLLAARPAADGTVLTAAVAGPATAPTSLTAAQRTALTGIHPDGSRHTRTLPGLGAYRVTALDQGGVRVLVGLPLAGVHSATHTLILTEVAVAAAGFTAAACACALLVRRRLRPLLERAESADAARRRSEERMRRFLADAGHELRTPLASIAGYAELMNRGPGPLAPDLAWRRVTAESARMTGLVEDLLLLARLDENESESEGRLPQRAEIDMVELVADAVWKARTVAEDHEWQLELHLDTPPLLLGDEKALRRAVDSLLANARQHTPPGTRVTVSLTTDGDDCAVRVRDDGPGIPGALLPTVFDRFTRADAGRTRAHGSPAGSGLGLAVATAIAGAHGGALTVQSEPGRTEFTLGLPLVQDALTRTGQ